LLWQSLFVARKNWIIALAINVSSISRLRQSFSIAGHIDGDFFPFYCFDRLLSLRILTWQAFLLPPARNFQNSSLVCFIWKYSLDGTVRVVMELGVFNVSSVVDPSGHLAIMVEDIPFSPEFDDRMLRCPSDDRLQNTPPVGKGPVRIIPRGIANAMGRSCGIRKVIGLGKRN